MVCNPMLLHPARKGPSSAPSGRDVFFDRFLGLEPQAHSYSPFGTKIGRTKISGALSLDQRAGLLFVTHLTPRSRAINPRANPKEPLLSPVPRDSRR
jgi:hypothetical protein